MSVSDEISMNFNSYLKFTEFSVIVLNFLKNILNISENDSFEIEISLREAINNAILHGNKAEWDRRVYLHFSWKRDFMRIVITDENDQPLDLDSLAERKESNDLLAFSGRGILLMKNYMDRVKFEKDRKGTSVILEKSF